MKNETVTPPFSTLSDIRSYKERLEAEIRKEEDGIAAEWRRLFREPSAKGRMTPSKRLASVMSTGAAAFDGLVLAWKLYRKYRNGTAFFRRRRH